MPTIAVAVAPHVRPGMMRPPSPARRGVNKTVKAPKKATCPALVCVSPQACKAYPSDAMAPSSMPAERTAASVKATGRHGANASAAMAKRPALKAHGPSSSCAPFTTATLPARMERAVRHRQVLYSSLDPSSLTQARRTAAEGHAHGRALPNSNVSKLSSMSPLNRGGSCCQALSSAGGNGGCTPLCTAASAAAAAAWASSVAERCGLWCAAGAGGGAAGGVSARTQRGVTLSTREQRCNTGGLARGLLPRHASSLDEWLVPRAHRILCAIRVSAISLWLVALEWHGC